MCWTPTHTHIHTPLFLIVAVCVRPALAARWGTLYCYQTEAIISFPRFTLQRNWRQFSQRCYFLHPHPGMMEIDSSLVHMTASFLTWLIIISISHNENKTDKVKIETVGFLSLRSSQPTSYSAYLDEELMRSWCCDVNQPTKFKNHNSLNAAWYLYKNVCVCCSGVPHVVGT